MMNQRRRPVERLPISVFATFGAVLLNALEHGCLYGLFCTVAANSMRSQNAMRGPLVAVTVLAAAVSPLGGARAQDGEAQVTRAATARVAVIGAGAAVSLPSLHAPVCATSAVAPRERRGAI
jgi:hypothetical protein